MLRHNRFIAVALLASLLAFAATKPDGLRAERATRAKLRQRRSFH